MSRFKTLFVLATVTGILVFSTIGLELFDGQSGAGAQAASNPEVQASFAKLGISVTVSQQNVELVVQGTTDSVFDGLTKGDVIEAVGPATGTPTASSASNIAGIPNQIDDHLITDGEFKLVVRRAKRLLPIKISSLQSISGLGDFPDSGGLAFNSWKNARHVHVTQSFDGISKGHHIKDVIVDGVQERSSSAATFARAIKLEGASGVVTLVVTDPKNAIAVSNKQVSTTKTVSFATAHSGISKFDYNLVSKKVVVSELASTGAAHLEGVKKGAEVLHINNQRWNSLAEFESLLRLHGTRAEFTLGVATERSSSLRVVDVTTQSTTSSTHGIEVKTSSGKVKIQSATGLAARSGLIKEDTVTHVDGIEVKTQEAFAHFFDKAIHLRRSARLTVVRNTETLTIELPGGSSASSIPFETQRGITGSTGNHVEFPPFIGPRKPEPAEIDADLSQAVANEVISARVELYYFRDAHRVAQLINRRVKSFNGPAVNRAERAAEGARDAFEDARSRRREVEFKAAETARELRQRRKELTTVVDQLRNQIRNSESGAEDQARRRIELQRQRDKHRTSFRLVEQSLTTIQAELAVAKNAKAAAEAELIELRLSQIKTLTERINTVRRLHGEQQERIRKLAGDSTPDAPAQRRDALAQQKQLLEQKETLTKKLDLLRAQNRDLQMGKPVSGNPKAYDEKLDSIRSTIARLQSQIDAKNATKKRIEDDIKVTEAQLESIDGRTEQKSIPALRETIQDLVQDVQNLERRVADEQLKVQQAEDRETRAAKDQFRREVAAAKTDPDTYVAADINSIDPVTQVSISVIGEGVVHLRGPRAGVVKIREMIDQIDHAVGQVKIGIMTVQVNGENGSRMENTLRRLEGHLGRGRYLTYVSGQLFRRAVAEVAVRVAAGLTPSSPGQARFSDSAEARAIDEPERWARYMQAFFGADFLKALRDVNPDTPVLDPFNKLLSLSSADSLTIVEALLLAALAKATHRKSIMQRFEYYISNELPKKDAEWVHINGIHKKFSLKWKGDACCGKCKVYRDGLRKYRFEALKAFLIRNYAEHPGGDDSAELWQVDDRMTPMQREIVKLVQGITAERIIREQRLALVEKRQLLGEARVTMTHAQKRILDSEINRLEGRHLDALEGLRGRKAALDKLIKQVVIAMEDDVYAQFYNPALEKVRAAASEWDVELGAVERATILTNNRAFGKVTPQATFQFDLPKRDIAIAEALKAAHALHRDLGPLVGNPDVNTLAKMFSRQSISGSTVDGSVKTLLPTLPSDTNQQDLLYADTTTPQKFGSELEKLIPDPAIYKFETGTGFEVRPVVQPDGQSVVFDLNYMYTTDLLEPTAPDEKKIGRVKRHFINTEVQLGMMEWREISRYEVALKAARTARGVPLLEDIPVLGLAFRPLPQAKKSIQKNIIIGQAVVYPTIEDLLGLKPTAIAGGGFGEDLKRAKQSQEGMHGRAQKLNEMLDEKLNEALGIDGLGRSAIDLPGPSPLMPTDRELQGLGVNGARDQRDRLSYDNAIRRTSYNTSARRTRNDATARGITNPRKPNGFGNYAPRASRPTRNKAVRSSGLRRSGDQKATIGIVQTTAPRVVGTFR